MAEEPVYDAEAVLLKLQSGLQSSQRWHGAEPRQARLSLHERAIQRRRLADVEIWRRKQRQCHQGDAIA
jgi:hypothetical protein